MCLSASPPAHRWLLRVTSIPVVYLFLKIFFFFSLSLAIVNNDWKNKIKNQWLEEREMLSSWVLIIIRLSKKDKAQTRSYGITIDRFHPPRARINKFSHGKTKGARSGWWLGRRDSSAGACLIIIRKRESNSTQNSEMMKPKLKRPMPQHFELNNADRNELS